MATNKTNTALQAAPATQTAAAQIAQQAKNTAAQQASAKQIAQQAQVSKLPYKPGTAQAETLPNKPGGATVQKYSAKATSLDGGSSPAAVAPTQSGETAPKQQMNINPVAPTQSGETAPKQQMNINPVAPKQSGETAPKQQTANDAGISHSSGKFGSSEALPNSVYGSAPYVGQVDPSLQGMVDPAVALKQAEQEKAAADLAKAWTGYDTQWIKTNRNSMIDPALATPLSGIHGTTATTTAPNTSTGAGSDAALRGMVDPALAQLQAGVTAYGSAARTGWDESGTKYWTTITQPDGRKVPGYIDQSGKSFYADGTPIQAGASVVAANGKTYTKQAESGAGNGSASGGTTTASGGAAASGGATAAPAQGVGTGVSEPRQGWDESGTKYWTTITQPDGTQVPGYIDQSGHSFYVDGTPIGAGASVAAANGQTYTKYGWDESGTRYWTTITQPDGTQVPGYIEDGHSFYADGTPIQVGASVTAANGQTYTKGQEPGAGATTAQQIWENAANVSAPEAPDLRPLLDQWKAATEAQQTAAIDYATQQGIDELQRAEADAQQGFRAAQEQITAEEMAARDNQALYAEARGDKGGIGAAQYDSVMNTAAINRQSVRDAQTKLSTDTARQIADLRAKGEFDKADAVLEVAQTYLSNLISLEQWAANYGLSAAQFNESVREWAKDYELSISEMLGEFNGQPTLSARSADRNAALSEANVTGYYNGQPTYAREKADKETANAKVQAYLSAGLMPDDALIAASDYTPELAQATLMANMAKGTTGGGTSALTTGAPAASIYDLFSDAQASGAGEAYITSARLKAMGLSGYDASALQKQYADWKQTNADSSYVNPGTEVSDTAKAILAWAQSPNGGAGIGRENLAHAIFEFHDGGGAYAYKDGRKYSANISLNDRNWLLQQLGLV